ncbi:MAG: DUF4394 domain-containing protein [Opitutaceae bacterium]|nr:DUF4394 domain-containing protein [Cytophagales bacterium]
MDFRPKTKELYVLGYNGKSNFAQLYTLNTMTGVATSVTPTPFTLALGSNLTGFDFNPMADRIRIVGSNNNNYRLNPITGGLAFTDTSLAYASTDFNFGKNPFVSSIGYTNSFDGTTATQLIGYDDSLNVFVLQSPPNRGTLTTTAATRLKVNLASPSNDLDIFYEKSSSSNITFLSANTGTSTNDSLYIVNFMSGAVVSKGLIGLGIAVKDIAAAIDSAFITSVTNIEGTNLFYGVNLYPNPLTEEVTLDFNLTTASEVELNVLNVMGDIIETKKSTRFSSGNNSIKISTERLTKGIYLFELKINGSVKSMIKGYK